MVLLAQIKISRNLAAWEIFVVKFVLKDRKNLFLIFTNLKRFIVAVEGISLILFLIKTYFFHIIPGDVGGIIFSGENQNTVIVFRHILGIC